MGEMGTGHVFKSSSFSWRKMEDFVIDNRVSWDLYGFLIDITHVYIYICIYIHIHLDCSNTYMMRVTLSDHQSRGESHSQGPIFRALMA